MTGLSYLPKYLCRLLPTAVRFRIGSVRNGPCTDIPVSSDTNPQRRHFLAGYTFAYPEFFTLELASLK